VKWQNARDEFERAFWLEKLREHGTVARAAIAAGVARTTAYKILARHSIPRGRRKVGAWHRPIPGDHRNDKHLGN
jgi:hypothetical protein